MKLFLILGCLKERGQNYLSLLILCASHYGGGVLELGVDLTDFHFESFGVGVALVEGVFGVGGGEGEEGKEGEEGGGEIHGCLLGLGDGGWHGLLILWDGEWCLVREWEWMFGCCGRWKLVICCGILMTKAMIPLYTYSIALLSICSSLLPPTSSLQTNSAQTTSRANCHHHIPISFSKTSSLRPSYPVLKLSPPSRLLRIANKRPTQAFQFEPPLRLRASNPTSVTRARPTGRGR